MSDGSQRPRRNRGGRGGAEPRARIAARAAQVWALAVHGYSQREVAERLGISQPAVCKILRRVAEQQWAELREHADRERVRHLARLNLVARESLTGYARSQEDDVQQTQRTIAASPNGRPQEVTELRVRKRTGDPRFLREVREATESALRHLPPVAPTVPVPAFDPSRLTETELDELERLRAKGTPANADHDDSNRVAA